MTRVCGVSPARDAVGRSRMARTGGSNRAPALSCPSCARPDKCPAYSRRDVAHPDDAHAMAQILPLLRIRRANKPGGFLSRRDESVRKDKETERKTQ
jgi:hypothetical protein